MCVTKKIWKISVKKTQKAQSKEEVEYLIKNWKSQTSVSIKAGE